MRSKRSRSVGLPAHMDKSRREFLQYSGAVVGASILASSWPHRAAAQSATFDYYISPTGSDSNPGTLAAPWAITSLSNVAANSNNVGNWNNIAGKRIGLLPGIYGVYSLWNNGTSSWNVPALNIPGGTAAAPTYIGSCNASGNYSPRTVQITASPSGTPGGGLPGTSASSIAILGQAYNIGKGYVTLDGLIVSDSNGYGIHLDGGNNAPTPGATSGAGFTVQNCEVYNIGGSTGNNPIGLLITDAVGAHVNNCLVHDVTGAMQNFGGIEGWRCIGNLYEYNTVYNCPEGLYDKSTFGLPGPSANGTYRYNYIEVAGAYQRAPVNGSGGGPCLNLGYTLHVYNNIFVVAAGTANNCVFLGVSDYEGHGWVSEESLLFYNNTIYVVGGVNGSIQQGLVWQADGNADSPPATVTHYNNVYVMGPPSYRAVGFGSAAGAVTLSDYNLLTCGASSLCFTLGTNEVSGTNQYTLAQWQTLGWDAHSIMTAPTFLNQGQLMTSGASSTTATAGYQLASGSAGVGAGRIGGVSTGAAVDMGAWGGTDVNTGLAIAQIGVNLGATTTAPTPVPMAPVLSVS